MFWCPLLPSSECCRCTAVTCLISWCSWTQPAGWADHVICHTGTHPPSSGGRWRRGSQVCASINAPSSLLMVSAPRFLISMAPFIIACIHGFLMQLLERFSSPPPAQKHQLIRYVTARQRQQFVFVTVKNPNPCQMKTQQTQTLSFFMPEVILMVNLIIFEWRLSPQDAWRSVTSWSCNSKRNVSRWSNFNNWSRACWEKRLLKGDKSCSLRRVVVWRESLALFTALLLKFCLLTVQQQNNYPLNTFHFHRAQRQQWQRRGVDPSLILRGRCRFCFSARTQCSETQKSLSVHLKGTGLLMIQCYACATCDAYSITVLYCVIRFKYVDFIVE